MPHPASSVPENWIELIWTAMRATYGASFDRQWECPAGADPVAHVASLKQLWGRKLAQFQQNPRAIRDALDNLPVHPPNLAEFAVLCRAQVSPNAPKLNPPTSREIPEQFRAAFKRLATPVEDTRPERVRVAARYVQLWGGAARLDPFRRAKLAEMRQIVADWEAQVERDRAREATMGEPACP